MPNPFKALEGLDPDCEPEPSSPPVESAELDEFPGLGASRDGSATGASGAPGSDALSTSVAMKLAALAATADLPSESIPDELRKIRGGPEVLARYPSIKKFVKVPFS